MRARRRARELGAPTELEGIGQAAARVGGLGKHPWAELAAEPGGAVATAGAGAVGGAEPIQRHTAAALWIAAGANPKEVAARAGHASVSFTLDRYLHLYPEADLSLRERLDAIWSANGGGS